MPTTTARSTLTLGLLAASLLAVGQQPAQAQHKQDSPAKPRQLVVATKRWTGDFDHMVERRMIRVLVPYSRTLYFNDKGRERGLTAELVRDFERYINQKYQKQLGSRPITVYLFPTTRDQLLAGVAGGLGDIAAGDLTVTEERLKLVDFVAPADQKGVSELVVTGPKSPSLASVDDLSGQTVHVRPATSYWEHLSALDERFRKEGKAPVKLVALPDPLEDEDKLEMLNAGLFGIVVVDDWMARMWAQVLPNVKVREDLVLHSGTKTGWAIRKGSPKLDEAVTDFHRNFTKTQGVVEQRLAQFMKRIRQIADPTETAESEHFEQTLDLFEKYGAQYAFDPLMLAAQGYQESRLDQAARSRVGAIGIMQIMPATGAEMKVGNIEITEPNIHAGAKYLDQLMTSYFPDANFSETDRPLFGFASYNAGPGNIARVRKEAAKRGLDPYQWFNNVELVTAEKLGIETTTYVRNIYKYYVAYKLLKEAKEARRKVREQVAPGKS